MTTLLTPFTEDQLAAALNFVEQVEPDEHTQERAVNLGSLAASLELTGDQDRLEVALEVLHVLQERQKVRVGEPLTALTGALVVAVKVSAGSSPRMQRMRDKRRALGLRKLELWVTDEDRELILAYAAKLSKKHEKTKAKGKA